MPVLRAEVLAVAERAYAAGDLEAALGTVDEVLAVDADAADAHMLRAAVLYALDRQEEAHAAAVAATTLAPASDIAHARLGSILEKLGRLPEAEACFRHADALSGGRKACSIVSVDAGLLPLLLGDAPLAVPEVVHRRTVSDPADCDFVVMACCDARYFGKYGFNFVGSLVASDLGKALVHLHVSDPDSDFNHVLETIESQLRPPALRITTETSPFAAAPPSTAKHSYYSCIRLLQLPDVLAAYGKPVVCLDIDSIVEAPLRAVVSASSSGDLGLVRRNPAHAPWSNILAGWIVANPTPAATSYLRLVRNYVLHFMRLGRAAWHLDQAACYCVLSMLHALDRSSIPPALRRLVERLRGGRRVPAPPRVTWLSPQLQSAVWQIGHSYDERLSDERFTRFSPRSGP